MPVKRALAGMFVAALLLTGCSEDTSGDAAPREDESSNTSSDTEAAEPEDGDTQPDPRVDSGLPIPRTYDDALAHFDALGSEPFNVRRFVMPSKNIYCTLKVKGIAPSCEINVGGVKDPDVCAGTPTDVVGRISFVGGRATPVCNTDTIQQPNAKVLDYGVAARFRNFKIMCLSESIGVTCINTKATEGFFLHKGEYVIFNAG